MLNPIFLDDKHEYDYRLVENVKDPSCPTHELYYSNSEVWTNPGEFIIGIKDTGDGFRILTPHAKYGRNIEYHDSLHLSILLRIIYRDRTVKIGENIIEL
jgi:hypothetical protein